MYTLSPPSQLRHTHWQGSHWRHPEGTVCDHKGKRESRKADYVLHTSLYTTVVALCSGPAWGETTSPTQTSHQSLAPLWFHFFGFQKKAILHEKTSESKYYITLSKKKQKQKTIKLQNYMQIIISFTIKCIPMNTYTCVYGKRCLGRRSLNY